MVHEGPWDATVAAWSNRSDMIGCSPHLAFEPDLPLDIAGMLRDAATKAGSSGPFALGYDTGIVDATLEELRSEAGWLRFDRDGADEVGTDDEVSPEQQITDVVRRGLAALASPEARRAAAGDHVVNRIYMGATREVDFACQAFRGRQLVGVVECAASKVLRASAYLYGRLLGGG